MTQKRDALGLLADAGFIPHEVAIALREQLGQLQRAQLAGMALQGIMARQTLAMTPGERAQTIDAARGLELAGEAVRLADILLEALDDTADK